MDDHQFKGEETESVEELSSVCSQIVLKCLYLARIVRLDILWPVNKLACAVTKRTKTCDKRLARLISYIHHTSEYRQCCYVGNTAQQCKMRLFQNSDFAGDLEDSKSTSGGVLCIFGCHTFVPRSWMYKKQTSVSHSSAEAEVISLDAGLRMDDIPALTLWDLVIEIFHSTPSKYNPKKLEQAKHAQPHSMQAHQRRSNLHWLHFIQHNTFWCWCHVVCIWRRWGRDSDDYQRSKSHNETCFTDPQNCSGLVVWQALFGPKNSDPLHWLQTPNRRHPNQR